MTRARRSILRNHHGGHAPVSYVELFFDLVYVFAITQLSHFLLLHLTLLGALQALLLFLAIWWAWIYTTWATNWLDPERGPVRVVIAMVMLASLVLSSALPNAFGHGGLVFALAYVGIQLGRTGFNAWAITRENARSARTQTRATAWFAFAAIFWIAGGIADLPLERMGWWSVALFVEYIAPVTRFRIPGFGSLATTDWDISGSHMAERCALFIIIALGEGIVVTGTEFSKLAPDTPAIAAFVTAFAGSFAVWWVYFDLGAKRGAHHIEHHADPGRVARTAFTYWHIPIVAGIVVLAVADEQTLAHPLHSADTPFLAALGGGGGLFLAGTMVFKKLTSERPWFPLSHTVGLWLLAALILWGWLAGPSRIAIAIALTALLYLVALWEWVSFHGGWIEQIEPRFGRLGPALARLSRRRRDRKLNRGSTREP